MAKLSDISKETIFFDEVVKKFIDITIAKTIIILLIPASFIVSWTFEVELPFFIPLSFLLLFLYLLFLTSKLELNYQCPKCSASVTYKKDLKYREINPVLFHTGKILDYVPTKQKQVDLEFKDYFLPSDICTNCKSEIKYFLIRKK